MVRDEVLPSGGQDTPDGYQQLIRIDQGGSATVYRALDTRFERTVALKILHSEGLDEHQLQRFNAECLAAGRVSSHPNIVTVYDAGTTPGNRRWLAMEYCSGGSLAHRVARGGPLPVAEVISIGARLCSALSAAHNAGVLHRDVKPHNVLLTSYGEPALADFGIASVRLSREGAPGIEEEPQPTSSTAYTVVHAAPEILQGGAGTMAADIYSLGSTLYTLLAGTAPFAPFADEAGTDLVPLVARILVGDLPMITRPGVPPELERLLRRSMAVRPDDRPASAAELGARLTDLGLQLAREEVRAVLPPDPSTITSPASGRRLLVTLGVLLGVLLALFTTLGLGLRSSVPANAAAPSAAKSADAYAPRGLTVVPGHDSGDLVVSWRMPIRPDVLATVIRSGPSLEGPRAIVSYNGSLQGAPRATLHGLPAGQRVCLTAANIVSVDENITRVASPPVCTAAR